MSSTLATASVAAFITALAVSTSPARPRIKGYALWSILTYVLGLGLLAFYALGVEGVVYPAATRASCAELIGTSISQAATRPDFTVSTQFHPPQVSCGFGSDVRILTSSNETSYWAGYWSAGHGLILMSPLLAGWGLLWARVDRGRAGDPPTRTRDV